ncbi:MAG: CHASE domain-containing protein [Alphaproteobacteria bacterium]|jgi:PAS domain S-box-containing protein|nr:CHASE domain-containing protein [Alphaproteobacteria bacterium]
MDTTKNNPIRTYILKLVLLTVLYFIGGEIGLTLAVPPGYATIIWPASGIAIGMLILHDWRLWPGILLGSFLINCHVSNAISLSDGFLFDKMLAALCIALGSSLQALVGYKLIQKCLGIPLVFHKATQPITLLILCGPLACLVAATIGVTTLYIGNILDAEAIAGNWLTWWLGDTMGVLVFLPLMLVAPGNKNRLSWRGQEIGTLPVLAMLTLLVPLGLTFYAWKISSENAYQETLAQFQTLSQENEKALLNRIDTYNYALLGGAGFLQGSNFVSRTEWRHYVETIDVQTNFPGINGIGVIDEVKPENLAPYIQSVRENEAPYFKIHPETQDRPYYIINYIEPVSINEAAVGLNVGFEDHRTEAANLARDTGRSAITKRIILVQDQEQTPGFLLFHPLYDKSKPINTVEERRAAFLKWVYAPFIAKNFLNDLTNSQKKNLHLEIYDGNEISADKLIFDDEKREDYNSYHPPLFTVQKQINVMQQTWTLVWKSTKNFELQSRNDNSLYILVGGLLFTGLFGMFLMVTTIRNTEIMEMLAGEGRFAVPVAIFLITAVGSVYLYDTLKSRESAYIQTIVQDETSKIEELISVHATEKLVALRRMAQRWEASRGTPFEEWQQDVRHYVDDLSGLETVEWVDETYHVRWAEPLKGNEKAIGLNILFDEQRERALKGAADRDSVTLTPPIDLVQGYKAFIAYAPIKIDNEFKGFIVGIFSIENFLNAAISDEIAGNYAVYIAYNNEEFYRNTLTEEILAPTFSAQSDIQIYDKEWRIEVIPTQQFVKNQQTSLPYILLLASLVIAILLSLTVRYVLISRIKSRHLQDSEETFRTALQNAPIGKALVSTEGKWLTVNKALCKLLGYNEDELLKIDFQTITHPEDLEKDLDLVRKTLTGELVTYQIEKRYIHKDGHEIWVLLTVSLVREIDNTPKYFIAQIQDITERRKIDQIKSEFVSMVSHELRTPLTSIRGSLGLIEGTMSDVIPDKAKQLISIAHKNCERLILLINDILDLDKITAGKMKFDMKDEKLGDLIQSGIESNAAFAAKYNVTFTVDRIPDQIHVNVDDSRWQQVFTNLLSNAAKFSPEGETIDIFITETNNAVRVSVKDKGPGIPREFRDRIFGKFSQADSTSSRNKGGTGLGLHISKQIVESMNGHIGFDSTVGEGSTFWFEFPVFNEHEITANTNSTDDKPLILHVEKDKDFARVLRSTLENNFNIIHAGNLRTAKKLLSENNVALVILALRFADGNGTSLINYIQAEYKTLPIVVLTSQEITTDIQEQVAATLVKSRASETKTITTINALMKTNKKG